MFIARTPSAGSGGSLPGVRAKKATTKRAAAATVAAMFQFIVLFS
ncbi:hypothetical protein ACWEHA_06675 [Amycolatopsis nivea]